MAYLRPIAMRNQCENACGVTFDNLPMVLGCRRDVPGRRACPGVPHQLRQRHYVGAGVGLP